MTFIYIGPFYYVKHCYTVLLFHPIVIYSKCSIILQTCQSIDLGIWHSVTKQIILLLLHDIKHYLQRVINSVQNILNTVYINSVYTELVIYTEVHRLRALQKERTYWRLFEWFCRVMSLEPKWNALLSTAKKNYNFFKLFCCLFNSNKTLWHGQCE